MFTKFNRVLLASGLVLTSLVGFGSSAFAETTGGGDINFNLPEVHELTWTQSIAADGSPQALQLYNDFASIKLGTINVKSNVATGFKVTVTSANEGIIQVGSTPATYQKMNYTLVYGSTTLDLSTGSAVGETYSALQPTCAESDGCSTDVNIAVSGVTGKAAGLYEDTLTFTLTKN
ncbi:hypothetical protein NON20_22655 [Synechocystis sp. B12]|nr:hypothetical protein NON20_22655 [Synechocystis sp. B12]